MNQEKDENLNENGQMILEENKEKKKILLLSIIGEIEGSMRRRRIKTKRQNMIMYCRDWRPLKMTMGWRGCLSC